jgi:hypothetical protein
VGSDADNFVGKIQDKARAAIDKLMGHEESSGDADPDLEPEPAPDQHIQHDGMVVLSEGQVEQDSAGDEDSDHDAASGAETGEAGAKGDAEQSTG